jgi:hypothetical protein
VLLKALDVIASLLQQDVVAIEDQRGIEQWKTVLAEQGLLVTPINTLLGLVKPIWRRWRYERDTEAWAACYQVARFLKKLSLRDVAELSSVALAGWRETEDNTRITTDTFPEKEVIDRWFPRKKLWKIIQGFAPRHGNGAVAEKSHLHRGHVNTISEKYEVMTFTEEQSKMLRRYGLSDIETYLNVKVVADNGPCIVVFVPKSWKTYRTISMEPAGTMFLQQGFVAGLESRIRAMCRGRSRRFRYWNISDYYSMNSEQRNRDAALLGSIDGAVATVDLSAASDSVLWELVSTLFCDSALWPLLCATRTEYAVIPKGTCGSKRDTIVQQRKFAPMGSRFCFPIETIVFAAVVEAIRLAHSGEYDDPFWMDDFAVFGDDICLPSELVPELVARLKELGFKVNVDKSFFEDAGTSSNHFRESCGDECLNGHIVTPKMIGRKFSGLLKPTDCTFKPWDKFPYDPTTISQLITMANEYNSFPTVRAVITKNLITDCKLPLYWDTEGLIGLKCIDDEPVLRPLYVDYEQDLFEHFGYMMIQQPTYEGMVKESLSSARLFDVLRATRQRGRLLYPEDRVDMRMAPYQDPEIVFTWAPLEHKWVTR